jgi:putative membrane protein
MLSFLAYFGVTLGLLIVGIFLFEITTKNKEFDLIFKKRNKTAALVLGGKMVGLAIVLESALRNSISITDLLVWGVIGIVTQLVVYILANVVIPKVKFYDAIEEDNVAVGVFLFLLSIAIGLLVSGSLTY